MFSLLLEKLKLKQHKKTLALIRFDGIGDYLHMRPFFPYLRQSKKYKNYRLLLIGRDNFISFAQKYDSSFFDHIHYIKIPMFKHNSLKRLLKEIKKYDIDELISPVHFLDPEMVVELFCSIKAKKKIIADCVSLNEEDKQRYIKEADFIIETEKKTLFEFDRYKSFFEKLLGESIPIKEPFLERTKTSPNKINYAVISPFASTEERSLSISDTASIILHILNHYPIKQIILLDNKKEKIKQLFQELQRNVNNEVHYQKKNIFLEKNKKRISWKKLKTFQETLPIIQNAQFLLTADTSFLHVGAMLHTKTIYVAGAKSYGIFHPYPKSFTHVYGIYPVNFSPQCSVKDISIKDIIRELDNIIKTSK